MVEISQIKKRHPTDNNQIWKKTFLVFGLIVLYYYVTNNGNYFFVSGATYTYHIVDYSMGFCTRFLPGAIYGALVGVYNQTAVSVYLHAIYFVFFLLLAYLITLFFSKYQNDKTECFILCLLFLAGPFSFGSFAQEFGELDFYWAFLFLISYSLLRKRHFMFLIPICLALMVMVHYGAILSYIPALLLLMLYFAALSKDKKTQRIYCLLFLLSFIVSVGCTLFFLFNDGKYVTYSMEEFNNILRSRNTDFLINYDYWIYRVPENADQYAVDYFTDFNDTSGLLLGIKNVLYQIKTTLIFRGRRNILETPLLLASIMIIPPTSLIIAVFRGYLQEKKRAVLSFITCVFLLLFFFSSIVPLLFSTDTVRWFVNSFIIIYTYFLTVLYYDYENGIILIRRLFRSIGYETVSLFVFIYASIVLNPYS